MERFEIVFEEGVVVDVVVFFERDVSNRDERLDLLKMDLIVIVFGVVVVNDQFKIEVALCRVYQETIVLLSIYSDHFSQSLSFAFPLLLLSFQVTEGNKLTKFEYWKD